MTVSLHKSTITKKVPTYHIESKFLQEINGFIKYIVSIMEGLFHVEK